MKKKETTYNIVQVKFFENEDIDILEEKLNKFLRKDIQVQKIHSRLDSFQHREKCIMVEYKQKTKNETNKKRSNECS